MKTSKDYMAEANAVVPRIDAEEAVARYNDSGAVFVDVRDGIAVAKTGTIKGAHHIPRGMLEFVADPDTQIHNSALNKNAPIYLICAAGGQAALAGKTLIDMGYENVTNIGGISAWKEAGGPTEG